MPARHNWTEAEDNRIREQRQARVSWDLIAAEIGLSRWTVIDHAKSLDLPAKLEPGVVALSRATEEWLNDADRDPLPPGHPETWGAITERTSLAGVAWPG